MCFARILNFDIPDLTAGTKERIGMQSIVPAPARPVVAPYGEGLFHIRRARTRKGYAASVTLLRRERLR